MNDRALKKAVEEELDWQPSIDAADVGVIAENGIVRLTGHVADYAQKIMAENAVKRVKGVRGYVDDLEIRTFQPIHADETIAERAANLIEWDVRVPGAVKVKVEKGFLTLSGQVEWQYQRQAAESRVRSLSGVRGVINMIQVKGRLKGADVGRRIKDALERQADFEADRIKITVEGGQVRLDGTVHSLIERDIAERAAWSAPGVTGVEDRVVVGG